MYCAYEANPGRYPDSPECAQGQLRRRISCPGAWLFARRQPLTELAQNLFGMLYAPGYRAKPRVAVTSWLSVAAWKILRKKRSDPLVTNKNHCQQQT